MPSKIYGMKEKYVMSSRRGGDHRNGWRRSRDFQQRGGDHKNGWRRSRDFQQEEEATTEIYEGLPLTHVIEADLIFFFSISFLMLICTTNALGPISDIGNAVLHKRRHKVEKIEDVQGG
jgi:hypothetical protein